MERLLDVNMLRRVLLGYIKIANIKKDIVGYRKVNIGKAQGD